MREGKADMIEFNDASEIKSESTAEGEPGVRTAEGLPGDIEDASWDWEKQHDKETQLAGVLAKYYEDAGLVARTDEFSWEYHMAFDEDIAASQQEQQPTAPPQTLGQQGSGLQEGARSAETDTDASETNAGSSEANGAVPVIGAGTSVTSAGSSKVGARSMGEIDSGFDVGFGGGFGGDGEVISERFEGGSYGQKASQVKKDPDCVFRFLVQ
jgi:hypothetical protein